jgi:hypothetical protein
MIFFTFLNTHLCFLIFFAFAPNKKKLGLQISLHYLIYYDILSIFHQVDEGMSILCTNERPQNATQMKVMF